MNKSIIYFVLCGFFLAACVDKKPFRIQVLDENNRPIEGAEVEFLNETYTTDAKGELMFPYFQKDLKVTVYKIGYTEVNTMVPLNSSQRRKVIHLESVYGDYESVRAVRMRQLLKGLKGYNPKDKSAKMVALGNWEAEFPGGARGLQKYINENVAYPESAIDNEEEGKVYVQFVVEANGSISKVKVAKGISTDLDAESKRIIKSMPRWIPAYANGVAVRTRCSLPIVYSLE